MRNQKGKIDSLASKYWDGSISNSELIELRKLLNTKNELDGDQKALQMMLCAFERIGEDHEDLKIKDITHKKALSIKLYKRIATIAALFIFAIITYKITDNQSKKEIYCYINGVAITDIDLALEQTKYFEHITELSQTIDDIERILNKE